MGNLSLKNLKNVMKSFLIILMIFLLQVELVSTNPTPINAAGAYDVEIVYGYGGSAGTKKAVDVIKNASTTDYSYKGKTPDGGYTNGPGSGDGNQFSQSQFKSNVGNFDIYYGDKNITITHAAGNTSLDKTVYVASDGSLNTTGSGTSVLKVAVNTNGIFFRFFNVTNNLKIVERYDRTITFNNVKEVNPSGYYHSNSVNDGVATLITPNIGNYASGYEVVFEKEENKELVSIDWLYANKYNYSIKGDNLTKTFYLTKNTTSPYVSNTTTNFSSTSATPLKYDGANSKFTIYELAQNASFTFNYEYNISFDANGGKVNGKDKDTLLTEKGVLSSLPSNLTHEADSDGCTYKFAGWFDDNKNEVTSKTVFTENTNVTAKWVKNYKITFDPKGGTFNPAVTNTYKYTDDKDYTGKLDSLFTLDKTKVDGKTYYFVGWFDGEDISSATQVTTDYVFTENKTIYAGWTDTTFTVTYDCNKALTGIDSFTAEVGSGLTPVKPEAPTKKGYSFVGWYTNNSYNEEFDFDNTAIAKATTIYGKYVETVDLTVDNNVNSISAQEANKFVKFDAENKTATVEKNANNNATVNVGLEHGTIKDIELTVGSKENTITDLIDGKDVTYYVDSQGSVQSSSNENDQLIISHDKDAEVFKVIFLKANNDVSLKVNYEQITIKYVDIVDEGEDPIILDTKKIDFGSSLLNAPENPDKEMYSFINWYKENTFENEFDFSTRLYDDTDVYAKFKKHHEVSIVYGYGKPFDSRFDLSDLGSFENIDDVFYGILENDFLNGSTASTNNGNQIQFPKQSEISSVDVYYKEDYKQLQHIVAPSIVSSGVNVIKGYVYLDNSGNLNYASGSASTPAGSALDILKFAATSASTTANCAARIYNVTGDLTLVFHYVNENKVTFNNIHSFDVDHISKYNVDDTNHSLSIPVKFIDEDPIVSDVTTIESKLVDSISIKVGDNNPVTIDGKDTKNTYYVSKNYILSDKASDGDIIKYENGKYSFYNINSNISVDYLYKKKVIFNPNGGAFSDQLETGVRYTTDSKVLEFPNDPVLTNKYFAGWYDGEDYTTANYIPQSYVYTNDETTLYAGWSDTPFYNVLVNNAFNSSGSAIETSTLPAWQNFDGSKSLGLLPEGSVNAQLTIHNYYGTLNGIKVNVGSEEVDLFDVTTSSDSVIKTIGDTKFTISYNESEKYFDVTISNIYDNILFDLSYEDIKVDFLFDDGTLAAPQAIVSFNSAVSKPADPTADNMVFDNWYVSKEYVEANVYDFSKLLKEDTTLYANMKNAYKVQFIGTGYLNTTGNKIKSSKWVETTKGTINEDASYVTTFGEFFDSEGIQLNAYTLLEKVKSVKVTYNGVTSEFDGSNLIGTRFLLADGSLTEVNARTNYESGDIFKFVVNESKSSGPNTEEINMRFYHIDNDITIEFVFGEVSANYVDDEDAITSMVLDAGEELVTVTDYGFEASESVFGGINDKSVRMNITPVEGKMIGLELYNIVDGEEILFKTWKYGDSAVATDYSVENGCDYDIGKIALGYSTTDGHYYVRFLYLYTDVVVKPIIANKDKQSTIKINSADGLYVNYDALSSSGPNKAVVVSEDRTEITVPFNALPRRNNGESFRWTLGSTAGCDYEYYKAVVKVGEAEYVLNDEVDSYKVSGKDISQSIHTPQVTILYNKGKNGDAQIRVWGVSDDASITMYYKNYDNEDIKEASDMDFARGEDGKEYTATLIQAKGLFVDIEALSDTLPNKDVKVSEDYKTLTVPYGTLTDGVAGYSVRWNLGSTAGTGFEYNKIEILNSEKEVISTVGASISSINDTSSSRTLSVGTRTPFISFSYNKSLNGEAQLRVWGVDDNVYLRLYFKNYDTGEVISAEEADFFIADPKKAPYKVTINQPNSLYIDYEAIGSKDSDYPNKDLIISDDMRIVTVPSYETLPKKATGYSFRWNLGATAGNDLEYYKLEVYNGKDELITTLGENLESWKKAGKDQALGIHTNAIEISYSKSRLSDAQIRFWSVACDIKLKIYFKNYSTGEVFAAEDAKFNEGDKNKSPYKVDIKTAKGIALEFETLKDEVIEKGVTISDDYKTFSIPYGSLTSKATTESVRWNLGNTCGTGYEYYQLEVLDKNGNSLLIFGDSLKSIDDVSADQTVGTHMTSIDISYNKGKCGDAQIRIWGVTDNITLRVYYKNYETGEVIAAEDAQFSLNYNVSVHYDDPEESRAFGVVDYMTADTKLSRNSKGIVVNAKLGAENLTGKNRQIEQHKDDSLTWYTSNILRFRFTDVGKYNVDSITISTKDKNGETISETFTEGVSKKVKGIADISYVINGVNRYVRINGIYTQNELVITPNIVEGPDGPYTVVLDSDDRLHVTYNEKNPKSVGVSKDYSTLTIKEGALPSVKDGESIRWDLSSCANMGFEYSKLEIYEYDPKTKQTGALLKTLGSNFISYLEAGKDQSDNATLRGLRIRLNKSTYCEEQIRIYGVYNNFKFVQYYKNYKTGEEYRADDEHLNFQYKGIVTFHSAGTNTEIENFNSKACKKLNGINKVQFTKFTTEDEGIRYVIRTAKEGDNIDSIVVTVNGVETEMGKDLQISKTTGKTFAGAKVRFYRNTDGWGIVRVWAITNDVDIKVNVSHGHKNTLKFDIGDHGTYRITEIPASAKLTKDGSNITLWRGSTYSSASGEKASVRYDVTPEVGWEIDYVAMTVEGKTYKVDARTAPVGKTLVTEIAPGCSLRYNLDSNGVAQLRFVHVDRDTSAKVYYRQRTYKVTYNVQKLSLIRAEGYGTSCHTEFTKNYAVAKIQSGTTIARQNGIKYWFAPLEGHAITSAVIENSKGEYVICGEGFAATQYEDYKVKGFTARYYQGYDGKVEIRCWGVGDNIKVTLFYDNEKPVPGMKLPDDIETYDIGEYVEPVDSKDDLIGDRYQEEEIEEEKKIDIVPIVAIGGGVVGLGAILALTRKFWLRLFKK